MSTTSGSPSPEPVPVEEGLFDLRTIRYPKSPIPRILDSNMVPPADKLGEIRSLVGETLTTVVHLDVEILKIERHLRRVTMARDRLQRFSAAHERTLHSYAQRMPHDIVVIIFSHYHIDLGMGGRRQPPWILGWICAGWRHIALSMPNLWTHIVMESSLHRTMIRDDGMKQQRCTARLRSQLSRTSQCNLGLWSDFTGGLGYSPAFHRLFPVLGRVKTIHLSCRWDDVDCEIISLLGQTPNVEECRLGWQNEVNFLSTKEHAHLPCLRSLEIDSAKGLGPNFWGNISAPALESLEVSRGVFRYVKDLDPSFVTFLLRVQAPLERLTIRGFGYSAGDWRVLLEALPSLTSLTLDEIPEPEDVLGVLTLGGSIFVLPGLRSFTFVNHGVPEAHGTMLAMIRSRHGWSDEKVGHNGPVCLHKISLVVDGLGEEGIQDLAKMEEGGLAVALVNTVRDEEADY